MRVLRLLASVINTNTFAVKSVVFILLSFYLSSFNCLIYYVFFSILLIAFCKISLTWVFVLKEVIRKSWLRENSEIITCLFTKKRINKLYRLFRFTHNCKCFVDIATVRIPPTLLANPPREVFFKLGEPSFTLPCEAAGRPHVTQ